MGRATSGSMTVTSRAVSPPSIQPWVRLGCGDGVPPVCMSTVCVVADTHSLRCPRSV
jgi:hypothetical protein